MTVAPSHKLKVGAVIGGAVGGCTLVIFALAIGLWWRRKHRQLVGRRDTEQHLSPGFDSELDSSAAVCEKPADPRITELVSNRGEAHELEQPRVAHEKSPDDYVCELDGSSQRNLG